MHKLLTNLIIFHFFHFFFIVKPFSLGYIWFPKSIKERKKLLKKMFFFMFGFTIKLSKEN